METASTNTAVAQPNFSAPPKTSLVRLYHPETQANSFALDGFPSVPAGKDWLARLVEIIETQGPLCMTTNQTLFRQLTDAGALDGRLRAMKSEGRSAAQIYQTLYNEAAMQAARAFRSVHERWPWEGRVSQEASALLTELEPLVKEVQRIAQAMQGVGAFTKIPNIPAGPAAIERALAGSGVVHPNITLVFSDKHYLDTVEGYLRGLSARAQALRAKRVSEQELRRDIGGIYSVNSLFVSRVDRAVDPMIDERIAGTTAQSDRQRLKLLKGKAAIAQAKKVYQMFEAVFLGAPFRDPEGLYSDEEGRELTQRIGALAGLYAQLKALGAHPQRLLIASSGVKSDQPYSQLLYVLPFLAPWCANTMPQQTLDVLSRFVEKLSDSEAAALRTRNMMREPLPDVPTDTQPVSDWERALLATPEQRAKQRIPSVAPDQVLRDLNTLVLKPAGTTLRRICDTLRDKGAASFTADEQATLQAIENKLQTL